MNEANQKAFAKFLTEEKQVLSTEQLKICLDVQKAMTEWGIKKSIDKVITEKGYIEISEMDRLVKEFIGGDEDYLPGYRIVKKLGEGAMGEVYEGIDLLNGERRVAIKILFSHLGKRKATAQRFIQEAELCIKKLNHPNIVKGFDVGYEGTHDSFFYAMELVEGHNLRKILKEQGPFEEVMAIKLMMQITSALQHAHQYHLVHRDIKPDNIMLTTDGEAKLCDLGLARDWAKDLSLTRTGAVMGTPFYISPEAAAASEKLDCRSDIYSFGATMYHMLVGKVPFGGNNTHVVLSRHLTEPLIPPLEQRSDLSLGLSAIIQMMMEKEPEKRYQTPDELLEDLRKWSMGIYPKALNLYRKTIEVYQIAEENIKVPEHSDMDFQSASAEIALEALHCSSEEVEMPQRDVMTIEKKTRGIKRQDSVEEYFVIQGEQQESPQSQDAIWSKFFTSSERIMLSNASHTKSKLLVLGAVIGGISLFAAIIICFLVIVVLKFLF